MAPRSFVSTLPKDIQLQLHQRLVDSNFSDYAGHTEWLASLGHSTTLSSVHRYGMENEEQIRSSVEKDKFFIDIRMRCLEVSAGFAEGDFDLLFKKADTMLNWVKLA